MIFDIHNFFFAVYLGSLFAMSKYKCICHYKHLHYKNEKELPFEDCE